MRERRFYYVYIVTNASQRPLYVGVTNSLFRRIDQHRAGSADAYTTQYRLFRLIYCERYSFVRNAIVREKQLKGWSRQKKLNLACVANPQLHDMRDYGILTFGDSYVGRVPGNKLKMTFDAAKKRSFGSGNE